MRIFKSQITAWAFLIGCVLHPPGSVDAQLSGNGKRLYLTYSSGCHGSTGKGDGPAAKMLPVKPPDHTQQTVMTRLTDRYFFQVISGGGKRVGKSSQMPGWGAVLKEEEIKDLIAYIPTLAESDHIKAEGKVK